MKTMTDQETAIAALSESLPPETAAEVALVIDRAKQDAIAQQFQQNLGSSYTVEELQPNWWEIRKIGSESMLFASLHCVGDRWELRPHPQLDRAIKADLQVALDKAIAAQEQAQ